MKYEEAVVNILFSVYLVAWRTGKVPEGWTLTVNVTSYNGKDERELCKNRGISLLCISG